MKIINKIKDIQALNHNNYANKPQKLLDLISK